MQRSLLNVMLNNEIECFVDKIKDTSERIFKGRFKIKYTYDPNFNSLSQNRTFCSPFFMFYSKLAEPIMPFFFFAVPWFRLIFQSIRLTFESISVTIQNNRKHSRDANTDGLWWANQRARNKPWQKKNSYCTWGTKIMIKKM